MTSVRLSNRNTPEIAPGRSKYQQFTHPGEGDIGGVQRMIAVPKSRTKTTNPVRGNFQLASAGIQSNPEAIRVERSIKLAGRPEKPRPMELKSAWEMLAPRAMMISALESIVLRVSDIAFQNVLGG